MGIYNFTYSKITIMITFIYKDVPYTLHYRAEKIFPHEFWMVSVTIQDQTFVRASTDKELFRKLSDLNCFYEIQKGLHQAFFESFKPEIINYLDK
jgi:hypothetical protein